MKQWRHWWLEWRQHPTDEWLDFCRYGKSSATAVGVVMRRLLLLVLVLLTVVLAGCSSAAHAKTATVTSDNPLNGQSLFVGPFNPAITQVRQWRSQGNDTAASALTRVASQQVGLWLADELPSRVAQARALVRAAAIRHQLPLLVVYDIPHRDCGGYSTGGAPADHAYLNWIYSVANAIGTYPAIVILEPDAVPQMASGCLPKAVMPAREHDLTTAVRTLETSPNSEVYLDAGGPAWGTHMAYLAQLMRASGVGSATGFALNVSNFQTLAANLTYGQQLSPLLGGKHFVIDTSRNGNGPSRSTDKPWCNPPGRKLGHPPTTHTGDSIVDAFLWIKQPGSSDGTCRGGPPAGTWWAPYALGLARR